MALPMYVIYLTTMALSLLTLNTGGCSSSIRNASFKAYLSHISSTPDVVFLQEANNLTEDSTSWKDWPYTPLCAPSLTCRTGVVTLLKTNKLTPLETKTLYCGHLLYAKIALKNSIYHLYNLLIPQSDAEGLCAIQSFYNHCKENCSNGAIVLGGDFNCTENPSLDRLCTLTEHRPNYVQDSH